MITWESTVSSRNWLGALKYQIKNNGALKSDVIFKLERRQEEVLKDFLPLHSYDIHTYKMQATSNVNDVMC